MPEKWPIEISGPLNFRLKTQNILTFLDFHRRGLPPHQKSASYHLELISSHKHGHTHMNTHACNIPLSENTILAFRLKTESCQWLQLPNQYQQNKKNPQIVGLGPSMCWINSLAGKHNASPLNTAVHFQLLWLRNAHQFSICYRLARIHMSNYSA